MTTYIALSTLTDAGIQYAGRQGLPTRHRRRQEPTLWTMGGDGNSFYMVMGEFDFVRLRGALTAAWRYVRLPGSGAWPCSAQRR